MYVCSPRDRLCIQRKDRRDTKTSQYWRVLAHSPDMQQCLQKGRILHRLTFSTGAKNIKAEVEGVHKALAEALEATQFISASAQQAYLETDPSARGQPESYTARYKTFACSQIDAAIAKYDSLSSEIGEAKMQEIRNESTDFGVAVADTLLARDQLQASIRDDEDRIERKISQGLRKDDLIFCDGPS